MKDTQHRKETTLRGPGWWSPGIDRVAVLAAVPRPDQRGELTMPKRSEKDYEAMSRDIESGDYTVRGEIEMGSTLRMGRPAKGTPSTGKTPSLTVRLPEGLRIQLEHRAHDEGVSVSELIRQSVAELLSRPGAGRG